MERTDVRQSVRAACAGAAVLVVLAATTGVSAPASQPRAADADARSVADANNRFGLELYAKLSGQEGNLFCSPYSISAALAMTYAGARGNTAGQMAKVLHFELDQDRLHAAFAALINNLNAGGKKGHYRLSLANALWGGKGEGFLAEFLALTNRHYGAGLNQVDFAGDTEGARKTINAWVEQQTQDKIKELLKQGVITPATSLVLTNAIYFKGDWASQFKVDQTKDQPFTLLDAKQIDVPMMHQTAEFKYMEEGDFQALELPYAGDDLAMTVLLPRKTDALPEFEKKLTTDNLTKWLSSLRKQKVVVTLPKFKMTWESELSKTLILMGMTDAFGSSADFSGMNGKRDLFIGAVVHKAFVDVNEEGTEAAAATAVVMLKSSAMPDKPPPVFRADHPFVFIIRDTKTGSILFIGRVMNPKPA